MSDSEKLQRERVSVRRRLRISRGEFLKLGVAAVVGSLSLFFGAVGCAGAGDGDGTDSEGTDGGEEDNGGGGGSGY